VRVNSVWAFIASGILFILLLVSGCGNEKSSNIITVPPPPQPSEFLFATSNAAVLTFSIDTSTGALTLEPNGPSAPGNFGIAATPSASFLYTSDNSAGGIAGFAISNTGALAAVSGSPFLLPNDPPGPGFPPVDGLAMHPSGNFLYAPDPPANEVVGFAIDATTGGLTSIPGSPFPAGDQPEQVVLTPSGQFLYVSDDPGAGVGGIWGFTVNSSTGALTTIAGSPFPTINGEGPDGLVVHPSGKFLYTAVTFADSIEGFTIDQTTGAIAEMQGSPFLLPLGERGDAFPYSIAQDAAGKFLYALGSADGYIFGFTVDANSGALTPVPGTPFDVSVELFASCLTVDPSGSFLYFSSEGSPYVNILSIDPTTGALSWTPQKSVLADSVPLGMTIVSVPQQ
jgi:6-phosphogluconolactonase